MVSRVIVAAPSTTANLGPGFDVFGLALDAFFDEIQLTKNKTRKVKIVTSSSVPTTLNKNTAGLVAKSLMKKLKIKDGIEIRIKKGVPPGFGIGSSAASAAATVVGFDKLFNLGLDNNHLVKFAGMGEKASAGSVHYDNVAASILGGFVIVRTNPLNVIRIEPPKNLVLCLAIPKIPVPIKKTKVSRMVIPKKISLKDSIVNLSNAASIVAGFMKKDPVIIGESIKDVIIEPARQHMIPGFVTIKKNALKAGALGVTISGAGPSVIAFGTKSSNWRKISASLKKGFASKGITSQNVICKPAKGAAVVKTI